MSDDAIPARKVTRTEVIREWVGGERYARDYEYCDANFKAQADRVLALFATPAPPIVSGSDERARGYMGAIVKGAAFIMDYGQEGAEELVRVADVQPADDVCCKVRISGTTFWQPEFEFRRRATPLAALAASRPTDAGAGPYLSDRFEWAAPGDQQEDAWIVRFCDQDVRDAYYTGPDAEAEG